ncbi:CoA activase [Bacteroidetes/Chlorobi group bacterium ChocPot_Mid]|jgi:benzoyl-CoA reductase subunit D|nr:MAG: CoA activase [Bacteroidetes/Chlorobi group bacterium ChocPot_Mid]
MISAGIDVGAKNIKIILLRNNEVIAREKILSGFEAKENVVSLYKKILEENGISQNEVSSITSTGSGRKEVDFANMSVTDVTAATKGVTTIYPSVRTVIDVGAEEGRGIRCDNNGKVIDFSINEKCAAGSGAFIEAMSRALEIPIEDFGPMSLQSEKEIPMNAQCAVFAESEVVSLLHAKTDKKDIAKAICDAIAARISSMVRKVGFEKDIAVIGGVAHNVGFLRSINSNLEAEVIVPDYPEYIAAYGAALITE